jgi:hypothetical protein
MAPSLTETVTEPAATFVESLKAKTVFNTSTILKPTGALDQFKSFDVTPVIGREFPDVDLVDWINAPNADELLKELAVTSMFLHFLHSSNAGTPKLSNPANSTPKTVSRRGVVFFRAQNNLTNDIQKALIQRLGELAGKPASSKLHIHPILNPEREGLGGDDPEISTISSKLHEKVYIDKTKKNVDAKKQSSSQWHADISFEPVPADYSSLRLTKLPSTGGGTFPYPLPYYQI